jgi:hypothetical protein
MSSHASPHPTPAASHLPAHLTSVAVGVRTAQVIAPRPALAGRLGSEPRTGPVERSYEESAR